MVVNYMFTVCVGLVFRSKYVQLGNHLLSPVQHKHQLSPAELQRYHINITRLLTYGKEEYDLNENGSYFITHFVFVIHIILLFSIRQQPG